MKKLLTTLALSTVMLTNVSFAHDIENLSAKDALKKLKQGNERFVKLKLQHPD